MIKKCVICGKEFKSHPSDKVVTCSPSCRSERARLVKIGKGPEWKSESKIRLAAKGQTSNLKYGTLAARLSPIAGSFETNQEALIWTIKSPNGVTYTVRNLTLFIKNNPNLFDGTVSQATHGIYQIKRGMLGKTKHPVSQWKGWELISWEIPDQEDKK